MDKKGNFAAGIIAGAVVGAISALLLAPKSGKQTRQDIARYAQKIGKKVAAEAIKAKNLTHEKYTEIIEKVVNEYQHNIPVAELKAMVNNLKKEWPKITKNIKSKKGNK